MSMLTKIQKGKPLTTGDIARYCHVSQVGVLKWIKSGKLKAYATPGGHYRILGRDFRQFLKQYNMPIDERFFSGQEKKILVVNNNPDEHQRIVQTLTGDNANYLVASAQDGYGAGLQVAAFKPDLVILDIRMSKLDAFEVCRQMKSNPHTQHIKILGLNGATQDAHMKKWQASGADACLGKPLNYDALKVEVRRLIGFSQRKEDGIRQVP